MEDLENGPVNKEEKVGENVKSVRPSTPAPRRRPKFRGTSVETVQIFRTYRCRVCSTAVGSIRELLSHLDAEHGIKATEQPRIVLASERDEKQDQEDVSNLLESIDRAKLNASSEDSVSSPNSQRIYRKDDPIFKRLNCVTKEELGSHLRCSHCFVDFSTRHRYRYLDHVESHRQEKFTDCQYCGMSFTFRYHLQSHLSGLEKYPDDRYQCQQCDSSFPNRQCMLFHLTRHHDGRHRCQICEMTFALSSQLGKHAKDKHPENGKLVCPECKKGEFANSKLLRRHMAKLHFKVVCPICQAVFPGEFNCEQHVKRMHAKHPPGSRPFVCSLCPQAFTAKAYLTRHYRQNHQLEPPGSLIKVTQQKEVAQVSNQEEVSTESSRTSIRARRSSNIDKNYNEDSGSEPETFLVQKNSQAQEKSMEVDNTDSDEKVGSNEEEKEIQSDDSNICNICLKKFSNEWNRVRHQRLIHTKQKFPTTKRRKVKRKNSQIKKPRAKSPIIPSENSDFTPENPPQGSPENKTEEPLQASTPKVTEDNPTQDIVSESEREVVEKNTELESLQGILNHLKDLSTSATIMYGPSLPPEIEYRPKPRSIRDEARRFSYSNPPSVETIDCEKEIIDAKATSIVSTISHSSIGPVTVIPDTVLPELAMCSVQNSAGGIILSSPNNVEKLISKPDSGSDVEEIFPCCVCEAFFTTKRDRMLHVTQTHTNRRII